MRMLSNSEDPDEMLQDQDLHCLLRQSPSSKKKIDMYYLEIITCDPLIYTMDHPKIIVSNYPYQLKHKISRDVQGLH